ncbi:MAG: thioredoxin domain-containing protein, partial [Deltaproteobacteria bacterium]|nr:thioredoxin domain-containing protein [Deltaproteobacteria bacterium]
DVLLLEQPDFSPPDLARYAQRIGLEVEHFESCLESGRHDAPIAADLELGESLGVHRTPTVFVNGLYLGRHPGYDEIDGAIRGEIERGRLTTSNVVEPKEVESAESGNGRGRDEGRPLLPLPSLPLDELPAPEVVLTLSRAEVERALEDREALDRKLEASSGVFSGQRLLKLRAIEEGDFYARLGLEEGDVLMLVNGRFVTREQGSVWDAFEQGEVVTLLVMRRGLPHTYEYRIGQGALDRAERAR